MYMNNDDNHKRSYLRRDRNNEFSLPIDFRHLADQGADLAEMFFQLTGELRKRYNINKGVLVVRRPDTNNFAAVSTWHNGARRDGLTVNLPPTSSLFEKVAEHGSVYTEEFCGSFSGNFFERKLLLADESRSFVVQPLKFDGEVVGLLGYSSEEPTTFALFEEGAIDTVSSDLAKVIREQNDA